MSAVSASERLACEERRASALRCLAREDGPCRIKLCGMFRDEDIEAVNLAMPDLCGFIFGFPKSHRNVTEPVAMRLMEGLDARILRTLVIVDQPLPEVVSHLSQLPVDLVQLHGNEDNEYVEALRSRTHLGIIQAFRIRGREDVERALASVADMVLLDAGQGEGRAFDWSLVGGFGARRPFILAGGLAPDNVAEAVRTLHPWGVDMSSGIETNRIKDPIKMAAAVAAVRSAL